MKTILTAVLISFTGLPLAGQTTAPPNDSARLQGTWAMVSGAADGSVMPAGYLQRMKRAAIGQEVTVTMGDRVFFKATISLDPTQSPKAIDYHMTAGPTAGAVQLGIYEFRGGGGGDTVRFCFGPAGGTRPREFATSPGDNRTLSEWVRVKP